MNIFQDLEDKLYLLLSEKFPTYTIILGNQNGQEPTLPYVCIKVKKLDAQGMSETDGKVTIVGGVGKIQTVQAYKAVVTFDCVSHTPTEGGEMAHQIDLYLRTRECIERQWAHHLALYNRGAVDQIPYMRETGWVYYYQQKCSFGYSVVIEEEVDWAESAEVSGVLYDAGREPTHTIPVTQVVE